jgi:hypothetical protein
MIINRGGRERDFKNKKEILNKLKEFNGMPLNTDILIFIILS